ncbi:MAG: hypothetical protein F6K19_38130 [Cyanothece sp. SIO1E1]|nr:hypothetical protein [Cyanothece sp. SIO1E1]
MQRPNWGQFQRSPISLKTTPKPQMGNLRAIAAALSSSPGTQLDYRCDINTLLRNSARTQPFS